MSKRAKIYGWMPGEVAILCQSPFTRVMSLSASLRCGSVLIFNWREIGWRHRLRWYLGSRRLSVKDRAELCATSIFSLIFYWLLVLPLSACRLLVLERLLFSLLWKSGRSMVRRQVCFQHPCNGGLAMLDLPNYWLAERFVFWGRSLTGDATLGCKVRAAFPNLKSNSEAESHRMLRDLSPYFRECWRVLRWQIRIFCHDSHIIRHATIIAE